MLYNFPSQFIYWEELPEHTDLRDELLEFINNDNAWNGDMYRERASQYWGSTLTTSYFRTQPLEFVTQEMYDQIVWCPFQRMYEEMETLPRAEQNYLAEFWYNQYNIGEHQEVHNHIKGNNATISGIYILESEAPSPLTFFNPNHPIAYQSGTTHSFDTKDLMEGTVILFPSCLLHYVKPAQSKRTTISFNIQTI